MDAKESERRSKHKGNGLLLNRPSMLDRAALWTDRIGGMNLVAAFSAECHNCLLFLIWLPLPAEWHFRNSKHSNVKILT
jgi:hypothetical protein